MDPIESYAPSRCNLICVSIVAADGTYQLGPDDWTVDHEAVGNYRINHGLGHSRYAVLPILSGGTHAATITLLNVGDESVTVFTTEDAVATDVAFTLTLLAVQ